MPPPRAFASYSHDSEEHKQWVLKLCTKLRENGVDVTLDEWDLNVGELMHPFMQEGIVDSDRVLVICTDRYVEKANALEGGVGYEISIFDTELDQDLKTDKFIPIIRQSIDDPKIPIALGVRSYIDFRNDECFEQKFDELIRSIQGNPINLKPSLGEYTSTKLPPVVEVSSHSLPKNTEIIESASDTYNVAFELARANDTLGWSRLVEQIRPNVFKSLIDWRQNELDGQKPEGHDQLVTAVDKAVDIVSPLISAALVGVKSCNERFNNQKSLFDDLLNIRNREEWQPSGYRVWINIPDALVYIYHSLHGSLCIITDQITLALGLARLKTNRTNDSQFIGRIWEHSQLMGWSESLGRICTENWHFLVNAYEKWEWLSYIFEDNEKYRASLTAYYLALHIHELASRIASGQEISPNNYNYNVPVNFLCEKNEIVQHAKSLLFHNSALSELWTCKDVTQKQMENSWYNWIYGCNRWLMEVYRDPCFDFDPLPHHNFFDNL